MKRECLLFYETESSLNRLKPYYHHSYLESNFCWRVSDAGRYYLIDLEALSKACTFLKDCNYLFIFRQTGREGERKRNISVWLPLTHPPRGTWPTTQTRALAGNRNFNLLVHRPVLNPLSHISQGRLYLFFFLERGGI